MYRLIRTIVRTQLAVAGDVAYIAGDLLTALIGRETLSQRRWQEGYCDAIFERTPPDLSPTDRLLYAIDHMGVNPYDRADV